MAENKLGIGMVSFPQEIGLNTVLSLEEFNRKVDDNVNYLLKPRIATISADYTMTDIDSVILVDGTHLITLPQASTTSGKVFTVKNVSSGVVTVDGYSNEQIDGATTYGLAALNHFVTVKSNGTGWSVIAKSVGDPGPTGPTGATGATGATGPTGPAGADGVFSAIASQAEAEAGSDNVKGMTPLRTQQHFASKLPLGISSGGTGQTTAQAAINALTDVSAATNEYVLTKDTATGNAIFKVSSSNPYTVGSSVEVNSATERTLDSRSYAKIKAITALNRGGTVTVSFELHGNGSNTYYARVYKNETGVGTVINDNLGSYPAAYTENFDVVPGDILSLRAYTPTAGALVYARNFKILVSNPTGPYIPEAESGY